jgi:SAM-dependent methyltransferase
MWNHRKSILLCAKGIGRILMVDFIREDQILMSEAANYHYFQFEMLLPFLKGDVLEIGGGIGNMTVQALRHADQMTSLTCIEADPDCYAKLAAGPFPSHLETRMIQGHFPNTVPENCLFDLIYHYNVLEHIEDDEQALAICLRLLKPGGIHFIFVPAFPCLYGSMDCMLKHHRRYKRKELISKLEYSGHRILQSRYCNPIGFLGWFVNNILPLQNHIESRMSMPFGQSLCIVATKDY